MYERQTRDLKPDQEAFARSTAGWDAARHEVAYGTESAVSAAGLERLAADLRQQQERRAAFSRRRAHNPDADVDHINDRNARFNKKLQRFYGKHTQDIRDALERGTAI